ncbi:MAG: NAD(P)/FAD-dependent oxidoreductase [candidate division Zixibacteria bacterium]|nr:NAD(P)/FAD-dependent oxidoreductase [candidate division Zixibacteria bacterium]
MAERRRIVILGSGFGGAYCAQELERRTRGSDVDILLIDRHNYFIFYPLLVEAGTGSLQPRHAVVSIRSFLKRSTFRMAEVQSIDVANQTVAYQVGGRSQVDRVRYDHLVLALGSVTKMPNVSGLAEYGFQMKSLADAVALRDRAIQMLERADATTDEEERRALLHFVVVGANFTGAEVAGEFHNFLREASRRYRNIRASECNVTLVELQDRILTAVDPDVSDYAVRKMRARGMRIALNTTVSQIAADHTILKTGERLGTHTTIWCAGIAAPPIIQTTDLPTDALGYLLCEPNFRVKDTDNVWAIGDCAVNIDPAGTVYPPTAQHAVREGQHLARNLAAVIKGRAPSPFEFSSLGALAALGCRTGVAKVFGIKLSGFTAWFLWRTVYLLKMPGWSRRLRVALDWTMDLFFRRDYVELGLHRPKGRESNA